MYKRILIATDGSAAAELAAKHGVALARATGAAVRIVTTTGPFELPAGFEPSPALPVQAYIEATVAEAHARIARVARMCEKAGVAFEVRHVGAGAAADAIVAQAAKDRCDLIVMGSHGRGSVKQVLLGSVSTRVVAISTTPVLLVRVSADAVRESRPDAPARASRPVAPARKRAAR